MHDELLKYIAENKIRIEFSDYIVLVVSVKGHSVKYHAKPKQGEALVYPTRLAALEAALFELSQK